MTIVELVKLMILFLGLAYGLGSDSVKGSSTSKGTQSAFLAACRQGEASPYAGFIARLGRKLRTTDCGELRRRLARSEHLYIGGQPLAGPDLRGRLKILAEFTQLSSLNINLTGTRDICPLVAVKNLRRLIARNNNIRDVSCLAQLTRLSEVNLGGNQIRQLTGLAKLSELRQLKVNDNQIEVLNLSEASAGLRVVQVQRNGLGRLIAGAAPNLKELGAGGNRLAASDVAGFTRLERLDLSANGLGDVTALASLKRLRYLSLSYNEITSLTPLRELQELKKLWLAENPLGTSIARTEANCPTQGASAGLAAWCGAEPR